jgi:hypothetical protein
VSFVAEVSPALIGDNNLLAEYSEGLFNWNDSAWKSMTLVRFPSRAGRDWTFGRINHVPTNRGDFRTSFAAVGMKGTAFVVITMAKQMFTEMYPLGSYRVRERFPPLRSRLMGMAKYALSAQLGAGYKGDAFQYPSQRDAIVIEEFLSRGPLSNAEVWQIVVGEFVDRSYPSSMILNSRLGALISALRTEGKIADYGEALAQVLRDGPINPAEEDALCGHVFGAMERHHVDYSAHALELIEGDRCVGLGLFFLSRALPPGDIGKIEALKVKPVYNSDKEMALHYMRGMARSAPPQN